MTTSPAASQFYHLVGEFTVVGDGVERLERRGERLAPRGEPLDGVFPVDR
jgi:hypothetical protein